MDPGEPEWPQMLSVVYEQRAPYCKSKSDKKRWIILAEESMERCFEPSNKGAMLALCAIVFVRESLFLLSFQQ